MTATSNRNTNNNSYHLKLVERVNAGDLASVQQLLSSSNEYSKSINNTDANGCTPLFYAAWMGREDICQELINNGADIFKEVKSFRPIHVAASKNHSYVVKLLISSGDTFYQSDIDRIQNSKKMRMKLSEEIIALAKEDSDIDRTTTFSVNHISQAGKTNSIEIESTTKERRLERFLLAVSQGDMNKVKKYLSKKVVKVNDIIQHNTSSQFFNMTALHVASKYNQHAAVVYLVKLGAQYMKKKQDDKNDRVSKSNENNRSPKRHKKINHFEQCFYDDLSNSLKSIIQACESSQTNTSELENRDVALEEENSQLNGYVQQLHEQVDNSLSSLFSC